MAQPVVFCKVYYSKQFEDDYLVAFFNLQSESTNIPVDQLHSALVKTRPEWKLLDPPKLSPFYSCTLDYFGETKQHQTTIEHYFDQTHNALILGKRSSPKTSSQIALRHAEECPCRDYFSLEAEPRQLLGEFVNPEPFMRIGVAILISNEKDQVLLTRRAAHMRTFAKTWVIPGGHLELGESLEEAGIRETREETGVTLQTSDVKVLGIYESVFPIQISMGLPTRHHTVIYLNAQVSSSKVQLHIDPQEVDAACWVHRSYLEMSLQDDPTLQASFPGLHYHPLSKDFQPHLFTLKNLEAIKDHRGVFPEERLSTGTRFIIREWLNQFQK